MCKHSKLLALFSIYIYYLIYTDGDTSTQPATKSVSQTQTLTQEQINNLTKGLNHKTRRKDPSWYKRYDSRFKDNRETGEQQDLRRLADTPNSGFPEFLQSGTDFNQDWSEKMANFVPSDIFSIIIGSHKTENFFENIEKNNTLVRGGFVSTSKIEQASLKFTILGPNGIKIYNNVGSEGIFVFNATTAGVYTFSVENKQYLEDQTVTIAISLGDLPVKNTQHLTEVDKTLSKLKADVNEIKVTSLIMWSHQKAYQSIAKKMYNKVYTFAWLTLIFIIGVSAFQVYYIKSLVSTKRVF